MSLLVDTPLLLPDAELDFHPQWLTAELADQWLQAIYQQTPWQQPQVNLFGRTHPVPRLLAWYGDEGVGYRYSGLYHAPLPWTPLLADIRAQLSAYVGQALNGLLLNYYRDGQDSMGWHSDDEPELGHNPIVVSLSLGGSRRFDLRRKGQQRIEHSLQLDHGSVLVMRGATQHYWQHQIAKTRKPSAPRLNLTFRYVLNGDGFGHE